MSVVAIVLAAGSSSRLGSPKQDLVFRGETLLHRAVRNAKEATPVVIVIAREPLAIDVPVIVNGHADEGIASSIRLGVHAATNASRILITLVDQPLVTGEHLRNLLATEGAIVATGYRGIAGAPAVFSSGYFDELLALHGDRGARVVIEAHRDETVVVPFEDAGVDIDTEEDVKRLL